MIAQKLTAIVAALSALFSTHINIEHNEKFAHHDSIYACYGLVAPVEKRCIHHIENKNLVKKLAGPYDRAVLRYAHRYRVSPDLVAAVVYVENGGDFQGSAHRVSSAGAIGVMQLMPTTAWDVLRVNPWNPSENIKGGIRYLSSLLKRFHGNKRLAVMAYNAGPSAIAQGYRPQAAVQYAQKVLELAEKV